MRKVKVINNDGGDGELTFGKVYDVLYTEITESFEILFIVNDLGQKEWYLHKGVLSGRYLFEDFTHKYRNSIIDDILC